MRKNPIFDAFEAKLKEFRNIGSENNEFYSKSLYHEDQNIKSVNYSHHTSILIEPSTITRKSFYIRTSYRFTSKINVTTLNKYKAYIGNYFKSRKNSGFVEGLNNKIKVLKRRCYGLCKTESLFQRIFLDLQGLRIYA